jgi:hypothetical protein
MKRIEISPIKEIVYPGRGGYTGFSICIWETDYSIPGSYHLMSPWGSVTGASELLKSKYVLEARFFVFGSLLDKVLINKNSLEDIEQISEKLLQGWTPIMDELTRKEKDLWKQNDRSGIHIDEMVDDKLRNFVQGIKSA